MAKEIERKFLVNDSSYRAMAVSATDIEQGYLSRRIDATVRVRLRGDKAYLTVKGRNDGVVRDEWEYPVPPEDAREMLARCCEPPVLSKTRYVVDFGGFSWEIDEFHGALEGLVLAEVELPEADTAFTIRPS